MPGVPEPYGTQIRDLRVRLELSQEGFARLSGVSLRTVARWEHGNVNPDPLSQARFERLRLLVEQLSPILPPGPLVRWLTTPLPDFKYRTPLDLIGSGFSTQAVQEWIQEKTGSAPPGPFLQLAFA